ncbi:MAG: SDR family oxidoreductase [Chloroflexia bacterium]
MSSVMLLTGGTGAIGGALLERILRESDAEVHLLLHQRGTGCSVADLLREVLGCEPEPEWERRIHVLHGDVARERLGLDRTEYDALKHTLTHVIHSAATTRFDLPLETARSVNVEGTRRVLALAEAAPRLEATAFLSTAYVAGRRTGVVGERERAHVCGFVNTYEQSKYEAELLIEGASGRVPIAVYRLSTVLGDSATGAVRHYTAPHHALRMMHLGLVSMLPGSDEYPVDLIGADYTARVLYSLFTEHFEAGGRFHITSPEGKCYTLGEIVEETYRLLAEHDPEWAARRYPQPHRAAGNVRAVRALGGAGEQPDHAGRCTGPHPLRATARVSQALRPRGAAPGAAGIRRRGARRSRVLRRRRRALPANGMGPTWLSDPP